MLLNMTEGKPLKLILPFMVPLLIGNIFQQLYNIADIIIVGRTIGVAALAAVGAVSPLFMMQVIITLGLGNGFTVVTGQRYGALDMNGMRRSIATGTVLSLISVLFIMSITYCSIDYVLQLMNIPPELFSDARSYVLIITDGLIAMMGYNFLSAVMRSLGDSKTPLYFLIVATIANILLALLFILYFGWGVPGSAVALVIAQAISALLCIIYIYRRFPQLHLSTKDICLTRTEIWEHLRMGLPMAVQFSVLGLSIIFMQSICNKFGANTIAGFTTAMRVEQLAVQPMISFGLAIAVFTAQNYGARRFDRIREAIKKCSFIIFVFACFAAVLMFLFGKNIIGIFLDNPDQEVLNAAYLYIAYSVPFYFFFSQMFIYRNACQGMGIALIPMMTGVVELFVRTGVAVFLTDSHGYLGICLASPIAWVSSFSVAYFSYRYFIKILESKSRLVTGNE
ncbi:MAG: MATE family efflux transporter [Phascolarctobacterium sp.]|nr:MATE family efflux transporter [Phascolarctobacterium sp.]